MLFTMFVPNILKAFVSLVLALKEKVQALSPSRTLTKEKGRKINLTGMYLLLT